MIEQGWRWLLAAALAVAGGGAAGSEATGDYAMDLGRVYGGYQRMLAMKEACDIAVASGRAANEKAFAAWQKQHQALIQDLQRRVETMIRLASRDQQEYVRNLGRYEGEILQERQDYKETLLALGPDELREQCQRVPEMLKGPGADLSRVYAAELATIRKRK
jgi:hypothetical protein